MGDSLPPPAEFDLVDSFARRRGPTIEIVLAEPKTDLSGGGLAVQLTRGGQSVTAPAEANGSRLVVRAPSHELGDGVWGLSVLRPESGVAPLAARLLVQGQRPVVLLWGAKPTRTVVPRHSAADPKTRAARAGAQVLDRAVAVLPPGPAKRVRRAVRRAARKVLK